jgi:PAS domain S-box-containing protein
MRELMEELPTAILYVVDEVVTWANPAAAVLLGRERSVLEGTGVFELVAQPERAKVEERYWARQSGQSVPRAYEVRSDRPDGTQVTLEILPHALGGRRHLVVARDVTRRVRGAALVTALSEVAADVQRGRTLQDVLSRASKGLEKMDLRLTLTHLDGEELVGSFVDSQHPLIAAIEKLLGRPFVGWRAPLLKQSGARQVLNEGRSIYIDDVGQLLPNFLHALPSEAIAEIRTLLPGSPFAQGTIAPLFVQGKRWGTAFLSGRKVTSDDAAALGLFAMQLASSLEAADVIENLERRNQELALMHAENARLYADVQRSYETLARTQRELVKRERLAALGELAAVVAHEVRNPLAVIFNSLGSLKRLGQNSADAPMLLEIVGEEADRLNRIVSDLLDFARPNEPSLQPESLEDVIGRAAEAASGAVAQQSVRLEMNISKDLPPVPADARMLRQAFINLVVNAIQATPKGGRVRLEATPVREGDRALACIEVIDEGPGIPANVVDHIFQPFFTTKATGTGLGLAVVKRIVDAHRGDVAFRSAPGQGTTFTVRLPI